MNREFNNIIDRIKTDDKICVEIKQHNPSGNPIVHIADRINNKAMIEQSGGIKEWFTDLQEKGVGKIQIQLHRKQGNACIRDGIAYNCELGKSEAMNEPKKPELPVTTPTMGLNMPGLSMPDMINLHVDRSMLGLTKRDLETEKEKTVRLEKEKHDLEEQVKRLEKSNDTKQFWGDLVKEAAPALAGIVTHLKAPGLASPVPEAPVLPNGLKGQLIKVIMDAKGIPEEHLMYTYHTLEGFANKNEQFVNELQHLLQQHNFIPNGKNSNN